MMQTCFEIARLHSTEQVEAELRIALSSKPRLTMGRLLPLHLARSPFIEGGELTPETLAEAMAIMGQTEPKGFCNALSDELAAAWRVQEIFPSDGEKSKSKYDAYSPEWMCDFMTLAATALPSLTYHQALWEIPLVALLHLGAAAQRKNGGATRRPDNEVFRMLQDINRES